MTFVRQVPRNRRAGLTIKHAVQLAALQYEIFKLKRNMR
jgi:hypothetical protein